MSASKYTGAGVQTSYVHSSIMCTYFTHTRKVMHVLQFAMTLRVCVITTHYLLFVSNGAAHCKHACSDSYW